MFWVEIAFELWVEALLNEPFMIFFFGTGTYSEGDDFALHCWLLHLLIWIGLYYQIFILLVSFVQLPNEITRIHSLNRELEVKIKNDIDEQVFILNKYAVIQDLNDALIYYKYE